MERRYATADVFTTQPMRGNPVAVVLDADGLTTQQMQALAVEFNYVETTFVLPAADPAHTAHVRIFTPDREIPFAGHPNIGTAFLLARERVSADGRLPARFVFEEAAGLVAIDLLHEDGAVVGAELLSPQPLVRHAEIDVARAAACLGLAPGDIATGAHLPQVISVGLPFLVLELASRKALRCARPNRQAYDAVLPLDGAHSVYAYTRDVSEDGAEMRCDLHARMFTGRMVEDPATGSATAAVTALLAELHGADLRLCVRQGEDMGRPSLLLTRSVRDGTSIRAHVGGRCTTMFAGSFDLF
jgi:trans-2,3-dihydro-3-hydroxyanthranilate isomerase